MISVKHFAFIGIATLLVSACTSSPTDTSPDTSVGESSVSSVAAGGSAQDLMIIVGYLRNKGLSVTLGEPISQPFFSVQGQQATIGTEAIQIYLYADVQSMQADASKVSPDGGSVGTSMMSWVGPPHFFKQGRILILYVGSDKKILEDLASAMGPQFAGR